MKRFFMLFGILGVFSAFGEGIIKNTNFKEYSNNFPRYWKGNENYIKFNNDKVVVDMTQCREDHALQQNFNVPAGKGLKITFKTASPQKKFYVTLEYWVKVNEKKEWRYCGGPGRTTEEGTEHVITYFPDNFIPNTMGLYFRAVPGTKASYYDLKAELFDPSASPKFCGGTIYSRGYDRPVPGKPGIFEIQRQTTIKNLPVIPGKTYRFDFAAQGIGTPNTPKKTHALRPVLYFPGTELTPDAQEYYEFPPEGTRMIPRSYRIQIPENAPEFIDLDLYPWRDSHFYIQFLSFRQDDSEMDSENLFYLNSPSHKDTVIENAPAIDRISGVLECNAKIVKVRVKQITIDGQNTTIEAKKNQNGKFTFEFSTVKPCNLTAELFDKTGKLQKTMEKTVRFVPATPNQVLFSKDNRTLIVDGKPFVAISGYSDVLSEEEVKFYRCIGVNTFRINLWGHKTVEQVLHYMDIVHRYGGKIIYHVDYPAEMDQATLKAWEKHAEYALPQKLRNHPALLAYFLVDEPSDWGRENTYAKVMYAKNYLDKVDPNHPVYNNNGPNLYMGKYFHQNSMRFGRDASDIFGMGIYPLPLTGAHGIIAGKSGIAILGDTARKYYHNYFEKRRLIWMTIQLFSWNTAPSRATYPDETQLRFMAFDSILNGGLGLSFYRVEDMYGVKDPRAVAALFAFEKVLADLNELSGVLVSERKNELEHDGVLSILYENNNVKYLVVINRTGKTIEYISPAWLTASKAEIFRQERKTKVENNKIKDILPPYALRVYAEGALPDPVIQADKKLAKEFIGRNPLMERLLK